MGHLTHRNELGAGFYSRAVLEEGDLLHLDLVRGVPGDLWNTLDSDHRALWLRVELDADASIEVTHTHDPRYHAEVDAEFYSAGPAITEPFAGRVLDPEMARRFEVMGGGAVIQVQTAYPIGLLILDELRAAGFIVWGGGVGIIAWAGGAGTHTPIRWGGEEA